MATINFHVVDLYHGDNVTSFRTAAANGVWGVIHKATTGATGTDSSYARRRRPARDANLLWGAYHWGTGADVAAQVRHFLNVAQPDSQTLVALDYEDQRMSLNQAREWLTLIEQQLGRKAVLYSGHLIKDKLGNRNDPFFGAHRLWLAHYNPNPVAQRSWRNYWLWQYTDGTDSNPRLVPKGVAGIPGDARGRLDCDSYDGTKNQLTAEWAS
jgi:lysozyme